MKGHPVATSALAATGLSAGLAVVAFGWSAAAGDAVSAFVAAQIVLASNACCAVVYLGLQRGLEIDREIDRDIEAVRVICAVSRGVGR